MSTSKYTYLERSIIKEGLWLGIPRRHVINFFEMMGWKQLKLTQALARRIIDGELYADIPWPDGSLGRMPPARQVERAREIKESWQSPQAKNPNYHRLQDVARRWLQRRLHEVREYLEKERNNQ